MMPIGGYIETPGDQNATMSHPPDPTEV